VGFREAFAKIECQIRWVADFELMCLAAALKAGAPDLLPSPLKKVQSFAEWFGL
jgi:hypothetical protein